jgi:hypothetical protein
MVEATTKSKNSPFQFSQHSAARKEIYYSIPVFGSIKYDETFMVSQ